MTRLSTYAAAAALALTAGLVGSSGSALADGYWGKPHVYLQVEGPSFGSGEYWRHRHFELELRRHEWERHRFEHRFNELRFDHPHFYNY